MRKNLVTREAENRIRGARLRDSFAASPLIRVACDELQRQFEEVARPGESAPPDVHRYVDFANRVAQRKFDEYLAADREIRVAKNLYTYLAEKRDDAATELAGVLAPAKQASDDLLPDKGAFKLWLHGPVARTPSSLHRQAEDLSFWIHETGDELGKPVLQGIRIEPDEIVAEVERYAEKLGGTLGSLDEVEGHLEVTRARARKAAEACDQSYLQVKATLQAVCCLGGEAAAAKKYGPPSLRKLQRSRKRKKRGVVAEQQESDLPSETRATNAEERDLQTGTRSTPVEESDLQTGESSTGVEQSDLEAETCSTGACRAESALPDGARRKRRRDFAVTRGGGGHGGRFPAVTDGVRGPRRGRLSVTGSVCGARGSRSEVTDTVRSPENRGRAPREGVTARIRRFFALG